MTESQILESLRQTLSRDFEPTQPRRDDEFTVQQFTQLVGVSETVARRRLADAVSSGAYTRRRMGGGFLYRKAIKRAGD